MEFFAAFTSRWRAHLLFAVILLVGIFARVWEFASLPPGLNVDEASIGVEAYYLYKFGVDRFGLSYPFILFHGEAGRTRYMPTC